MREYYFIAGFVKLSDTVTPGMYKTILWQNVLYLVYCLYILTFFCIDRLVDAYEALAHALDIPLLDHYSDQLLNVCVQSDDMGLYDECTQL